MLHRLIHQVYKMRHNVPNIPHNMVHVLPPCVSAADAVIQAPLVHSDRMLLQRTESRMTYLQNCL
eukprot:3370336-Karenia_brevis.AAC.1